MSGKVVSLETGQKTSSKNAEQLILDAAKEVESGTVAGLVLITVFLDGDSTYRISGDADFNPDAMLGALERAKYSVIEMSID